MTDSMKFGPEWLRNMSAEPSVVSSNVTASVSSSLSLHSVGPGAGNNLASHTQTTASRNLFPEYRYGREEMLSLFDRNCLLPQILPSFKKLFVDKVQYPLALTPSSEEEINSHSPLGSSARPAWLQRQTGGFGTASRGSGRGGTVDRGRMRGKSAYHPIYQRPNAIYDENLAVVSAKSERSWNERNGTGDSSAVGAASISGAISGCAGLDWNGTPSSSPRKEFSSHNRNLENWRRNRNEDGSGDGPASGNLAGIEVSGWRSGGTHRWGRSTSWRDDESIQGGNPDGTSNVQAHLQRSTSAIGTVATERSKLTGTSIGAVPGVNRVISSKWSTNNNSCTADGDDSLPEWAVENPSEMGGTFDSTGAFHGESAETKLKSNIRAQHQSEFDSTKLQRANEKSELDGQTPIKIEKTQVKDSPEYEDSGKGKETLDSETTLIKNGKTIDLNKIDSGSVQKSTPTHKLTTVHGDISERFKEVADEVEKLIMDDDGGRVDGVMVEVTNTHIFEISNQPISLNNPTLLPRPNQHISQQTESVGTAMSLPFSDHLAMEQHHQQQLQQQHHLSVLPGHMINANPNDLWFYRDPQANVQGPFNAIEMTEWYRAGYFNENLFVRRFSDSRFRPLGELIKLCHGNMPFTHCHLLPTPIDLDNLQISMTSRKPPALNPLPLPIPEQQIRPGVDEQLRASVTAAADSLSAAVKGQMSTNSHITDTSHMLTMRFQMLQDQYLQHQEYLILSELSKNECFQRLDAAQREAIVRSKVQMLVLPEYLSSFSGLSNSLAALNPLAGSQLYNVIAQQAKKDQHQQQHMFSGNIDQHQRTGGVLMDANDFIINAQLMHQQYQEQGQIKPPSPLEQVQQHQLPELSKANDLPGNEIDILNEYNLRMLLRGTAATPNQQQEVGSQLLVGQNLMIPMWQQHQSEPWSSMPNAKVTLWDVSTLEEEQNQQLLLQQQRLESNSNEKNHLDFEPKPEPGKIEEQQMIDQDSHPKDQKQKLHEGIQAQQQTIVKQPNKQVAPAQKLQGKHLEMKIGDDERRREFVEEKRRLKEERKRQQQEDEKRRTLIAEEEKNRQIQEEKERQQHIQAQRRKALLGNSPAAVTESVTTVNSTINTIAAGGANKGQQGRSNSTSIAPWSLQPVGVNNTAPGLAEIQKAERRERRADQQRQQEQLDKQMRATAAAAAEANDALLKWQASAAPAQVMSLADIQAEEAKRLANDLLEQQRRREHEQHQQAAPQVGLNVSSGLANIWGNANKAWSGSTSSVTAVTGSCLWDDTVPTIGATTAASVLAAGLPAGTTSINNKQSSQPKSSSTNLSSPRNLRKCLTLPAMQSVSTSKNSKSTIQSQQQSDKNKVVINKGTSKITSSGDDKKSIAKNQQLSSDASSSSKINEYENEFTLWCMKSLDNMSAKVDVPTFVAFLQDLEAPYEVKDYVRIYLGEGKESSDFAKQFLERRSKYKNLQRAQNAHNDDMCKPAPAITPSSNDNGDSKNKQKKIKKNKMTKMDARILGFSVTAAEGRINVGGRDYVEGP